MNHPGFLRLAASPVMAVLLASNTLAQQSSPAAVNATPVPHLVSYSGTLRDGNGKPITGIMGVTFLLYRDEQGGAGVRPDAWANAHRIPVEQLKPEKERGSYLQTELFGAPEEKSIAWAGHPETMKRAKERQPLPAPPSIPASAKH